jgi:hypothetical protein
MIAEWLLPPLAVQVGLSCLAAQIVLTFLLAVVMPAGPWTKLPGVTAHQLVCLPLMMYLSYRGFVVWFTQQGELDAQGMEGRIFGVSPGGADMGAFVWGMMLFWDIPVSFLVPSLQDTLMLAHHVGMLFVSGVSMGVFSSGHPIGSYYAPFFFGMIEFSSVFLSIVDLFHPNNAAWHTWMEDSKTSVADLARTVNEVCRPLFALSYLAMRCALFPYVMFTTCLMDFWKASMLATEEEKHGISSITLILVCLLCLGFTLLQLNWGVLVAKQVAKAIGLIPNSSGNKDEAKSTTKKD